MTRSRNAFTLVELLVVIAIIGVIAAMLLPAVQYAREAARRATCVNSLRQLAMAATAHESRKNRLPGAIELIGKQKANWVVAMLADLDQQQLYDNWADNSVATGNANKPFIGFFFCPSRPGRNTTIASNSYIANLGFGPRSIDPAPFNTSLTVVGPTSGYDYWEAHRKENGAFVDRFSDRVNPWSVPKHKITVTSTDFHDGRGSTVLFSESLAAGQWHVPGYSTAMVWLYANETGTSTNVVANWITKTVLTPTAIPTVARINGDKTTLTSVSGAQDARPSSMHSGGVNAAFADGSTKFLSEQIDYHVYQSIMALRDSHSDVPHSKYILAGSDLEP